MGSFAVLLPKLVGAAIQRIGLTVRRWCIMCYTDQIKLLYQEFIYWGFVVVIRFFCFALFWFLVVFLF